MEMEDHHHHHHQHHEQQQYGITDLRQLVNGPRSTTHFPTAELFPAGHHHPNLTATTHHHYEMMMFGRQVSDIMPRCGLHDFAASTDSPTTAAVAATNNTNIAAVATTPTTTTSASTPPLSGLEAETAGCIGGVDASTGRWPRQETLTLLEIRSRLDSKFKEANQKGPLWDEVSRIMCEEHGYQRSGKKCREKFENLYKYYKKTKEGKAGRQDGKHYRFFRQLEALYGENINNNNSTSLPETNFAPFQTSSHNNNPSQTNQEMLIHSHHKYCDSLSLTNSTEFYTSSSDDNDDHNSTGGGVIKDNDTIEKRRKRVSSGRSWKVKIKDFIDLQMRKLVEKQEEWLEKLTKTLEQKERERVLREEEWRRQEAERLEREHKFWAKERAWIEARDAALMEALQKLTGSEMGAGIQNQNEDGSENEIVLNTKDRNKKRKENSRSCFYFDNNNDRSCSLYNQGGTYCDINDNDQRQETAAAGRVQTNDGSSVPSNSNAVAAESCFHPFLMSEGGNLWENYSLKVNKENQNQ